MYRVFDFLSQTRLRNAAVSGKYPFSLIKLVSTLVMKGRKSVPHLREVPQGVLRWKSLCSE